MMEPNEEEETKHSYSASYQCEDGIVKVVRIEFMRQVETDDDTIDKPVNSACLEIQKTGINAITKGLIFNQGMAVVHETQYIGQDITEKLLDYPEKRNALLEEYAREFGEIFMGNSKIMKYSGRHFTQLSGAIAKYVQMTRISTAKNLRSKQPGEKPPMLPPKPEETS
jgi:hypothetical protein